MTRWNPSPASAAEVSEQVAAYYERTKAAMPKPVPLSPAEQAESRGPLRRRGACPMSFTFRLEPDGTWTVFCPRDELVIETGYYTLADAVAEADEDDCPGEECEISRAETQAEIRSGIPREYAEN